MEIIIDKLRKDGKYNIAFVGDSLTSCEWVHPNWREMVEYVLKEELCDKFNDYRTTSWGIRCFNFGFDGSTTKDILDRSEEILAMKPDLIISLTGGNDPKFGIKPEEAKNNIENLMKKFEGIKVFWMTSLVELREDKNTEYEAYRKATLEVECGENQEIFDAFGEYKKNDLSRIYALATDEYKEENYKNDPVHPNQLGNAYVAKIVLEKIWNISFDPEKYIETTLKGNKYPEY